MFALKRPAFINFRFLSALAKNMEKHAIVPDVIDKIPKEVCEVNKITNQTFPE